MVVLIYAGGFAQKALWTLMFVLIYIGEVAQKALGMLMFVLIYVRGGGGVPKKPSGC